MTGTRLLYIADIRFPMERANAIQSINTCHALAKKGIDVNFIVRKTDKRSGTECLEYYGLEPHNNLKLKRVRVVNSHKSFLINKLSFLLSSLFAVAGLSFTRKRLIYFTRDLRLAQLYSILAKVSRAKIIFESHTISHRHFEEIHNLYSDIENISKKKISKKKQFEKYVYSKMDGIITITEHLKEQLTADFNPRCEIEVARDAATPDKKFKRSDKVSGIYYIGQLYPWKGVELLIEAMKNIPGEKLYIIGGLEYEDDLANLKTLADKLGVAERVKFVGTVPHKEVHNYIIKAKICVIPLPFSQIAAYYTSPMKMFEYLAAGKAIVASDLPSLCEVLIDKHNSLLFKAGNSQSLVYALKNIISDDNLRTKLERNAWETSKIYSWEKRAEKIVSLIDRI